MWLTTTGIFLGTQISFLEPIPYNSSFPRLTRDIEIQQDYLKYFSPDGYAKTDLYSGNVLAFDTDRTVEQSWVIDTFSFSSFILQQDRYSFARLSDYSYEERIFKFEPGIVSGKRETQFDFLNLHGDFNKQPHLSQTKAFWNSNTEIGSINLALHMGDRAQLLKSSASWHIDSDLGSFALKGNFDAKTNFVRGNASWKAQTALGEIAIRGNFNEETIFAGGNAAWNTTKSFYSLSFQGDFDRNTVFTEGNIKISTNTFIGSVSADLRIDEETRFRGANAWWNTRFLFGSGLNISGKFNETSSFDGGSIRLTKKTAMGTLNLKANVDRQINFTDVWLKLEFALP